MATKKMTVTVTTGNATGPKRRTTSTSRSGGTKKGALRTGEKLKPKKPVTENPLTWIPWLFTTLHNTRKRARAGKQALNERQAKLSDWSHRKGEQMHQNRQAKQERRQTFRRNMKGMVECKNCTTDDQGNLISTWHRQSDALKHIEDEHGGTISPAPQPTNGQSGGGGTNRPVNKTKAAAAAAAGGAALGKAMTNAAKGKIDHGDPNSPHYQPPPTAPSTQSRGTTRPVENSSTADTQAAIAQQNKIDKEARRTSRRRQPGRHRANSSNVKKGPWPGSTREKESARSEGWRKGMASLDGVGEAMNTWAANPPETWEQSMAEAEQAAEEFRSMADAFRRRAEAEVEQNNIAPECVEPYEEAAGIASQIADHVMEVATRIQQKYGEVKEMADRGELPRPDWLSEGAKAGTGAGSGR